MGRVAGAPGEEPDLTRWAFAVADVQAGVDPPVALILPPTLIDRLPPLRGPALIGAANGGRRGVQRRQVLRALAARALSTPIDQQLCVASDGKRRLAGQDVYASVAERAGWVAAVLSRWPVGIDIEDAAEAAASAEIVRDRTIGALDMVRWHGLAGIWAAREATLKAMGRDLTRDAQGWRFGDGMVDATGITAHRVDLFSWSTMVAAVAYAGT